MDQEVTVPLEVVEREAVTLTNTESSLCVAPLAELLEKFNTHAATDARDKIYALFSLSSDLGNSLALRADYTKSWSTLFDDTIRHYLGTTASVTTWDDKEQALIAGSGCPIGMLIKDANHEVVFDSPKFVGIRSRTISWTFSLPLPGFDENIKPGDILCLMEGASYPSLIRRIGTYFVVIKLALTRMPSLMIHESKTETRYVSWDDPARCISTFPRYSTLVWDWHPFFENNKDSHEALMS